MTYFLTSITMPDPQTSDMRQIRYQMLHLLASACYELYVQTIFYIEKYLKNIFFFTIFLFLFFWFSNMILSDALILHISQLQTQQVMTSKIRSHTEYLNICITLFWSFIVKIYETFSRNGSF